MYGNSEKTQRDDIVRTLIQQLDEFDTLQCIYSGEKEIVLTDPTALQEIKTFLGCNLDCKPPYLDFVLNLKFEGVKLELCVTLPSFYPEREEPDLCVRCNQLNRAQETKLNADVAKFVKENFQNEVFIYTVVSWLQDNISTYINLNVVEKKEKIVPKAVNDKFARYWIYSHHIYNKKKREDIQSKAKDLNLTGFCLPGKPGIICIEGDESNCKDWWRDIKSLTWKKITLRKIEIFEDSERENQQKFKEFNELHFQNPSSRHSKHADMSGFSKYMDECGLSQGFNDFFGLCDNDE